MKIYSILSIVFGCVSVIISIIAIISAVRTRKICLQFKQQADRLRKHNQYQQHEIEKLREHNGKLYDENLILKRNSGLSNLPDFRQDW